MTNSMTIQSDGWKVIVGVDTHKHVHVAVAIDTRGIRLSDQSFVADSGGYRALLTWATAHGRIAGSQQDSSPSSWGSSAVSGHGDRRIVASVKRRELLASTSTPDRMRMTLSLHAGHYYVEVDGRGLMSTRAPGSEKALGDLAAQELTDNSHPRVLIGGLGLGFTLGAALDQDPVLFA